MVDVEIPVIFEIYMHYDDVEVAVKVIDEVTDEIENIDDIDSLDEFIALDVDDEDEGHLRLEMEALDEMV